MLIPIHHNMEKFPFHCCSFEPFYLMVLSSEVYIVLHSLGNRQNNKKKLLVDGCARCFAYFRACACHWEINKIIKRSYWWMVVHAVLHSSTHARACNVNIIPVMLYLDYTYLDRFHENFLCKEKI